MVTPSKMMVLIIDLGKQTVHGLFKLHGDILKKKKAMVTPNKLMVLIKLLGHQTVLGACSHAHRHTQKPWLPQQKILRTEVH